MRFAPSPNGYLHIGHAYSALLNFSFARRGGGRFLLRIEDIDTTRARRDFELAIYEDLAWLGIRWEEPVRRQSNHSGQYREALRRLAARDLLYPCFCTRKDIRDRAPAGGRGHDPDGSPLYPGTCRHLSAGEREELQGAGKPFALRLDMARALEAAQAQTGTRTLRWNEYLEADEPRPMDAQPQVWGDVILARKDIGTSYHIASVVDDHLQGISDVIRGRDIQASTAIHRLLQVLLALPEPDYRHHRLLLDSAESKYSKSKGSTSLRSLRAGGATPDSVKADIMRILEAQAGEP